MSVVDIEVRRTPEFDFTFDQVVEDLINSMSEEDRQGWLAAKETDLIKCHFSTGMAIRNHYGLWHGSPAVAAGVHPDDASHEIVKAVWARVQADEVKKQIPENPELTKAVEVAKREPEDVWVRQWHEAADAWRGPRMGR
jgi:hypothetical protein